MCIEYTWHTARCVGDGDGRHEKALKEYAEDDVLFFLFFWFEFAVPVVDGAIGGVEHPLAVLLACAQAKPARVDTGCAMAGQTVERMRVQV